MTVFFAFCVALAMSMGLMPSVIRRLQRSRIMDIPNRRSSHEVPVPRGGGFGMLMPLVPIMTVTLAAGILTFDSFTAAILTGLSGMILIGFLDDVLSLSATTRLISEGLLMAVCLVMAPMPVREISLPMLPPLATGAAGWILAWLFLVGFPNLFNFMDGINGLAGSQALIASATFAYLAQFSGNGTLAILVAAAAGGSLGFLRYNFPQARVFMGDSGSLPIGFLLAAAALKLGAPESGIPLVVPLLVLWVFLFDAGLTLLIRSLRGRRLHHAHREHLYQRLVFLGYSHTRVTSVYVVIMLGVAAVALIYMDATESVRLTLLAGLVLVSGGLAALVFHAYRRVSIRCGE